MVYVAYLLGCVAFAAFGLAVWRFSAGKAACGWNFPVRRPRLHSNGAPANLRRVLAGALCFFAGAGYLALDELMGGEWDQWPGLVMLLAGLCAFGATLALRSALLLGKDLRRDFLHSFTTLTLMIVPD